MENLIKTIKKMKNDNPDTFNPLLEQMKHRARIGKIPGVTVSMIEEACQHILFEEEEMCIIPVTTLRLFLEAEEVLGYLEEDADCTQYLTESDVFTDICILEEDYINGENLLEDLLEVKYETV